LREIDLTQSLLPRHHNVLRAIGAISTHVSTDSWCLVGGMMVLIACRLTGRTVERAEETRDADILVDICSSPSILAKVVNELDNFGFQLIEPFRGEEFARCTFTNSTGPGQIDVLCPEDATEDELKAVSGLQSLAIPGGRRALQVAEEVLITYDVDAPDVRIRVPLLPGAVVVKAAAAIDHRTVNQTRHVQDVVDMLLVLEDPIGVRPRLNDADLELLSSLRPRLEDDGDVAWERVSEQARLRARAAFDILVGLAL
jgi:hypothetical protein